MAFPFFCFECGCFCFSISVFDCLGYRDFRSLNVMMSYWISGIKMALPGFLECIHSFGLNETFQH